MIMARRKRTSYYITPYRKRKGLLGLIYRFIGNCFRAVGIIAVAIFVFKYQSGKEAVKQTPNEAQETRAIKAKQEETQMLKQYAASIMAGVEIVDNALDKAKKTCTYPRSFRGPNELERPGHCRHEGNGTWQVSTYYTATSPRTGLKTKYKITGRATFEDGHISWITYKVN